MNGYYEDIDEDLDEMTHESDDEGLAERRRRQRSRARGGGYSPMRGSRERSVNEEQFHAALLRVGEDVKKLQTGVTTLERDAGGSLRRVRRDHQNFAMMSMLMPLLMRGKTVEVTATDGTTARVTVESDSTLSMLLPMLMLSQSSNSGGDGSANLMGGNMGMMLMMILLLDDKNKK